MKIYSIFILFLTISFAPAILKAQTPEADKIIGVWVTADKKGQIQIYKVGNAYFGKLIGGNQFYEADGKTLRKDIHNPDKAKQSRTIKDIVLMTDFVYDDGVWEDGKIYDPTDGKSYSCVVKISGNNTLNVRGYIGFSMIGRTEVWTRK